MTWKFSDGTTVELGGNVEGDSLLAQTLREDLADPDLQVQLWPIGFPSEKLDRDDVRHMHAWLLQQVNRPSDRWMMVHMTAHPDEVTDLPAPPASDAPEDAIF